VDKEIHLILKARGKEKTALWDIRLQSGGCLNNFSKSSLAFSFRGTFKVGLPMLLLLLLLYEAVCSQLVRAMQGSRFWSSARLCMGTPVVLCGWKSNEGSCREGRNPGAL